MFFARPVFRACPFTGNGWTTLWASFSGETLKLFLRTRICHLLCKTLMHAPMFIPDSAGLGSVLKQMQTTKTHFACVVDEHGGVEGIITLEDLLEEIVGEIDDEFDDEVRAQIVTDGGSYVLSGRLVIRDANRVLKLKLPEHDGFTTIAGLSHGSIRQAAERR